MLLPRASPCPKGGRSGAASWILTSPICRLGSPRAARTLWRELRAAGFPGTAKQVPRWVAEHRTAPAPSTPHQWRTKASAHTPRPAPQDGPPPLPSPPQLAWLLVQPPSALAGPDAALVARVEQDPAAAHVAGLARRLTALVRG